MSAVGSAICGEGTTIKFDVMNNTFIKSSADTKVFVEGLLTATTDKTALQFKEIVMCRTTVSHKYCTERCDIQWSHQMLNINNPVSPEKILKMMQYDPKLSNDAWMQYITKVNDEGLAMQQVS